MPRPDTPPGGRPGERILFVIGSLEFGGAELHLRLITPELRRLGWDPTVFCLTRKGPQARHVEAAGVEVIAPPFTLPPSLRFAPLGGLQVALAGLKLLGTLLFRRPRIVHFFLPGAYVIGGPLSILARTPVRIMSRRSLDNYQARWPRLRKVELWLHKRMTVILGNSSRVVAQLVEREGCAPEKVQLIYNGIETGRYHEDANRAETRAALGIDSQAFVAVIVANLIAYKGHADLLHGLAQSREALPPGWTLLAIGRDDGELDALKRLAGDLGIADHVRFLGLRTDIPALLGAADIGILASHQEGFSNALIESMAAGLAMIATDVGGNPDAVVHGETGLVVPPHDPEALGAAVATLAQQPKKARAMGDAGRRRAKELYSLERCVNEYDRLYRTLIETSERR